MVLLGDIIQLQQNFSNLTTSIPSLDNLIFQTQVKNKIYDVQSAPSCNGMYMVLCALMASHLRENRPIVLIDTMNKFPLQFLKLQPHFQQSWLDNITYYRCDTFAKLYSILIDVTIPSDTILIINEFHQLLQVYKLELSSIYEDLILKHHIEINDTFINNKKTQDKDPLPELPSNSDLLKSSPIVKYESHVNSLITNLKNKCINLNAMVFLLGYLDTKYRPYKAATKQELVESFNSMSPTPSSSSLSSFSEKGRVVLSPFKTHKSLDIKLIFYHDWYHNSPHFRNQYCKTTNSEKTTPTTTIDEYQLRLVYAAQIMMFQMNSSSTTNSSNPVFFDADNEFHSQTSDNTYDELFDNHSNNKQNHYTMIDLNQQYTVPDISSSPNVEDLTMLNATNAECSFIVEKIGTPTAIDTHDIIEDSEDELPIISTNSMST